MRLDHIAALRQLFAGHVQELLPAEYLSILERYFHVRHSVVKISADGLAFCRAYPRQWQALCAAGLSEADLLTKALFLVLQKR